jgi:hypothetical protein
VKTFRLWLLLLMVALLPLRGALAAGMLCPVGGFGVQAEAQLAKHAHLHDAGAMRHDHTVQLASAHDHGTQHATDPSHGAGHHHAGSGSGDEAGSGADKCNLCSAFCSVTGLVSTGITVGEAQPLSTIFPHLYAPPSSFFPDGQERPPRTI